MSMMRVKLFSGFIRYMVYPAFFVYMQVSSHAPAQPQRITFRRAYLISLLCLMAVEYNLSLIDDF